MKAQVAWSRIWAAGILGLKAKSKSAGGLVLIEARALHPERGELVRAALDFIFERELQELKVSERVVVRLVQAQIECLEHA